MFPWIKTPRIGVCLFAFGVGAHVAPACGPFFPNRYFDMSESQLLAAPDAIFYDELMRLLPPDAPRAQTLMVDRAKTRERSLAADVNELADALKAAKRGEAEVRALTSAYREARRKAEDGGKPEKLPKALPEEFALYFEGAVAWRGDEPTSPVEARVAWEKVLALPEAGRRHRSVWAAYMIGRSHLSMINGMDIEESRAHASEAARWFKRTRELAEAGFTDVLGLAAESVGWEAKGVLLSGDGAGAIRLYVKQLATGDGTAVLSLREAAALVVRDSDEKKRGELASDPLVRSVIVAYLLSKGSPTYDYGVDEEWDHRMKAWAEAIHASGGANVQGADRLAWLAYEGGLFKLSADWAKLAPANSAEARWLRAKLALRSGDLAKGTEQLQAALAAKTLAPAHESQVYAELGRVLLAQDRPLAALDAWMAGDHWEDSAFVAERVLSADELIDYVDRRASLPAKVFRKVNTVTLRDESVESRDEPDLDGALKNLLARRLARAGRSALAAGYFTEEKPEYAAYVDDVKMAYENDRSATERAELFWRAAQALRENGMEWMGTELEPDWCIWGGSFELSPTAEARRSAALAGGMVAPTSDELGRLAEHKVPTERFHYRYKAADLAWWAASLMPNDSEETARVLWTAGSWIKARNPAAANRFYQALVIRCGNTSIGREAMLKNWFPNSISEPSDAAVDEPDAGGRERGAVRRHRKM